MLASLRAAGALSFLYAVTALAQGAFELEPGVRVLPPIRHAQLMVFPVIQDGTAPKPQDYLSLAAGLERKEVRVREMPDGGDVNHVRVSNKSERPLLLLGGEIILGGQQDRVMSEDTVIPPKQTVVVEVFCVEHGRWAGRGEFARAGGMAEGKVRRMAKFAKNQGLVWDEVAKKTAALGGQSETGTYRTLAEGSAGKRATEPYRKAVLAALTALPEAPKVVGVIGALNGRLVSVDVFASPALFATYRERLLDSLFVTAADEAEVKDAPAPTERDIKAFMQDADGAKEEEALNVGGTRTVKQRGEKALNSKVRAPGATKDDKPVYQSYQAKE